MRKFLIVLCCGMLACNAFAVEEENKIDRLFNAMNLSKMIDDMHQQVEMVMENTQSQLNVKDDEMHIYRKYNEELSNVIRQEISSDAYFDEMRNLYLQNFTIEEISALTEFYESPVGQSFVQKMPVVMQESMMIGQRMAMQAMPKIRQLSEQLQSELRAYREQSKNQNE